MPDIKDIESIITDLIRANESIVSAYDAGMLCSDYDNAKNNLKKLIVKKQEIIDNLEKSMNEFFKIRQNFITRRIPVMSFKLIGKVTAFEYRFNIPKTVSTTSRQYFFYTSLMDRLTKKYDVITLQRDGYYILDITATLNLKKLLEVSE